MTSAPPLSGVRVLEFAGIGPAPFATMLLADMGAEVLRIDRLGPREWPEIPVVSRGRATLALDLKSEVDLTTCLSAMSRADVLIEGFRPGVMERLGLGPESALQANPRLIYGRITGWGQEGPLAATAGHDINYIAVAGALSLLGDPASPPSPPLNLLGDYAGGSLYLVMGILAALLERQRSGRGQIVDAAIVDGVASMLSPAMGMSAAGVVDLNRSANLLGGIRAPHYRCYRCLDGGYVAVGCLEPKFRVELCKKLALPIDTLDGVDDPERWESIANILSTRLATRTRDEWMQIMRGSDACVTPVLTPREAAMHPHLFHRETIVERDGVLEPAVAPRLSRTPLKLAGGNKDGKERLSDWQAD